MPTVGLFNKEGNKIEDIQLNDNIFAVEVNADAMHQVVVALLANKRQGTQSAKTRAEVKGGGRKPWKQKGTGRARAGSINSPVFTGGGVTFAPKPRDYSYKVPKKVRRLALKSALTSKVLSNEIIVIDEINFDAPRTKDMANFLTKVNADKKALIVMGERNVNVIKSASNIPNVATALVNTINVYDILKYNSFIITKDAVRKVEEVYA